LCAGIGAAVAIALVVFALQRHGPGPVAARGLASVTRGTVSPDPATSRISPTSAASAASAARASAPLAPAHSNPLSAQAAAFTAGRSGVVVTAVYDLDTGQTWTLGNTNRKQDEASIVKLDILETLLTQHRTGLSSARQALAQQMIEDSDNDAATALWDAVGGATGIRAYNATIGLTGTVPSACVQCPGFPWPGWGLTTTTPQDQIALLRKLVSPNRVLNTGGRDFALRLLKNVTPSQRWGISGGVPAQVTVALKNGWLPLNAAETNWQIHSVGWVSGMGRNYLIAVLSSGNPSEAYGIDTINALSAIVWNRMG
jgi:beta-lactamase class A